MFSKTFKIFKITMTAQIKSLLSQRRKKTGFVWERVNKQQFFYSELEAFADSKSKVVQMTISVFSGVEKYCGRRRKW